MSGFLSVLFILGISNPVAIPPVDVCGDVSIVDTLNMNVNISESLSYWEAEGGEVNCNSSIS